MRQLKEKRLKARKGSTLLISLLILGVILTVTATISGLAYFEILRSRQYGETAIATYAAESALEQAAYRVRNRGAVASDLGGSPGLPSGNGSTWMRQAYSFSPTLDFNDLSKSLTRTFDFYNPDQADSSGAKASVKLIITNYYDNTYYERCNGSEWFELGFVKYDIATGALGNFQKFRYNCAAGTNTIVNGSLDPNAAYRFYIRYLQGSQDKIARISVSGCTNVAGTAGCNMPGRIRVISTGTYRKTSRFMTLDLPRVSAVSGIFDYALFSECQIVKDPLNPNPLCP
jgi:hypothetical protein